MVEDCRRKFREAMDDDFNAPAALAVLFDFAREVNIALSSDREPPVQDLIGYAGIFRELAGDVLGLLPDLDATSAGREGGLIQLLIDLRKEARDRKDWALSDSIRDRLAGIGVTLEDGKNGTTWKIT